MHVGIGGTALGVGFRAPFADWLMEGPELVDSVELTAEHFFDHPERAAAVAEVHPVAVHGLGMSIGSADEDPEWHARFEAVCRAATPRWVSDHLAFTRAVGVDLGHLNPLSLDEAMLERIAVRADRVQQQLGCQFLLENITSHLQVPGTIAEPDFLTRIAERTGAGVLLDLTNLYATRPITALILSPGSRDSIQGTSFSTTSSGSLGWVRVLKICTTAWCRPSC